MPEAMITQADKGLVHVPLCPRCGGEHRSVLRAFANGAFKVNDALGRTVASYTHYTVCLKNYGEPVLVNPVDAPTGDRPAEEESGVPAEATAS